MNQDLFSDYSFIKNVRFQYSVASYFCDNCYCKQASNYFTSPIRVGMKEGFRVHPICKVNGSLYVTLSMKVCQQHRLS